MKRAKIVLAILIGAALLLLLVLGLRHAPSPSRNGLRAGFGSPDAPPSEPSQALSSGIPDDRPNLTGWVIEDLTGQRVAGIVIEAYARRETSDGSIQAVSAGRSGPAGEYALRLPPGRYELRWFEELDSLEKKACLGALSVEIPPERALRVDLHFEHFPIVIVEGRVVDAATLQPVSRAQPLITRDAKDWDKRFEENVRTPASTMKNRFTDFLGIDHLLTGEDGTFRASARLVPGKYLVSLAAIEGYKPYFGERHGSGFTVVAGVTEQRYFVELRMLPEQRTRITGRVVTRSGEPVADARLGIRNGIKMAEAWTDQDGRYSYWVTSDPVTVGIRHARYRTLQYELGPVSPSDASKEDLTRVLEPKSLGVSVNAVDESGASVSLDRLWVAENKLGAENPANPLFQVALPGGKSQFFAEPGLAYSFLLPPGAPWKISGVEAGDGSPTSAGIHFTFQASENGIKLHLAPKRP